LVTASRFRLYAPEAPLRWSVACVVGGSFFVCFCLFKVSIFLTISYAWIVVGGNRFYIELPDQKDQGFLLLIALKRLFSEHVCKVFDEIRMRT
jgi:hypothetical protein